MRRFTVVKFTLLFFDFGSSTALWPSSPEGFSSSCVSLVSRVVYEELSEAGAGAGAGAGTEVLAFGSSAGAINTSEYSALLRCKSTVKKMSDSHKEPYPAKNILG